MSVNRDPLTQLVNTLDQITTDLGQSKAHASLIHQANQQLNTLITTISQRTLVPTSEYEIQTFVQLKEKVRHTNEAIKKVIHPSRQSWLQKLFVYFWPPLPELHEVPFLKTLLAVCKEPIPPSKGFWRSLLRLHTISLEEAFGNMIVKLRKESITSKLVSRNTIQAITNQLKQSAVQDPSKNMIFVEDVPNSNQLTIHHQFPAISTTVTVHEQGYQYSINQGTGQKIASTFDEIFSGSGMQPGQYVLLSDSARLHEIDTVLKNPLISNPTHLFTQLDWLRGTQSRNHSLGVAMNLPNRAYLLLKGNPAKQQKYYLYIEDPTAAHKCKEIQFHIANGMLYEEPEEKIHFTFEAMCRVYGAEQPMKEVLQTELSKIKKTDFGPHYHDSISNTSDANEILRGNITNKIVLWKMPGSEFLWCSWLNQQLYVIHAELCFTPNEDAEGIELKQYYIQAADGYQSSQNVSQFIPSDDFLTFIQRKAGIVKNSQP